MRKLQSLLALTLLLGSLTPKSWADKDDQDERLGNAADAMKEIMALPEGIPADLLDKAECVCVFPSVKKVALGVGGSYGKGAMICRTGEAFTGPWGAPAMMRLEGGSFGFKGAKSVLEIKVKLGADAAIAAGPVGRTAAAATDAVMNAEILSYSRSKGLFAGVSLEGSTVREDKDDNKDLYGREIGAKEILLGGAVGIPAGGKRLVGLLQETSPENKSGK
jgi:lipid-binding SYLF domain-containing protein